MGAVIHAWGTCHKTAGFPRAQATRFTKQNIRQDETCSSPACELGLSP